MTDLEKKLHELLFELPQKRGDYKDLLQKYNKELLSKQELQRDVENMHSEVKKLHTQLELTNKALHKCEEERSAMRDSTIKHRLSLDAANQTIERVKEQNSRLHLENGKLKKQLEELDRDVKAESYFRESLNTKQMKIKSANESLIVQMRNIEKDQRDMERLVKETNSKCEKGRLIIEHKNTVIANLQENLVELSHKLVSLTSENKTLKDSMVEKRPPNHHYAKEILQEWQSSVNEMKAKISSHEKENEMLQQTLKSAFDGQSKFQNLEALSSERVRELEKKHQEAQKAKKMNETDCSVQTDLTISIDVACETTRIEVQTSATQTESQTVMITEEEDEIKNYSRVDNEPVADEEKKTHNVQGAQTYSFGSTFINNTMISSKSSLSDLMSKYQMEKENSSRPAMTDLCALPTQPNPNLEPPLQLQ